MTDWIKLEDYLNSLPHEPKEGKWVVNLRNQQKDILEINQEGEDSYRININDRSFVLDKKEFDLFVTSSHLGNVDPQDQFRLKYKGQSMDQAKRFSSDGRRFFSFVIREFGSPIQRCRTPEEESFIREVHELTANGDRLFKVPPYRASFSPDLQSVFRNSLIVGNGSGVLVQLPGDRLAIITSAHVIEFSIDGSLPKALSVKIGNQTYETILHSRFTRISPPGDDFAVLTFNDSDMRALRRKGHEGTPVAKTTNYPERFDIVLQSGYPFIFRRYGQDFSLAKASLALSSGILLEDAIREHSTDSQDQPDPRNTIRTSAVGLPSGSGEGVFWFNPHSKSLVCIAVHQSGSYHGSDPHPEAVSPADGNIFGRRESTAVMITVERILDLLGLD